MADLGGLALSPAGFAVQNAPVLAHRRPCLMRKPVPAPIPLRRHSTRIDFRFWVLPYISVLVLFPALATDTLKPLLRVARSGQVCIYWLWRHCSFCRDCLWRERTSIYPWCSPCFACDALSRLTGDALLAPLT